MYQVEATKGVLGVSVLAAARGARPHVLKYLERPWGPLQKAVLARLPPPPRQICKKALSSKIFAPGGEDCWGGCLKHTIIVTVSPARQEEVMGRRARTNIIIR